VSDANVVLGYLNPKALAGGTVPIDAALSRAAVGRIAAALSRALLETAYGIHTVANANMMKAVKAVTTYRGRDPRDFVLFAFGGNGGVHAVDLARVLQIRRVLVPMAAGVLSAVGMLFSKQEVTLTQPFHHLAVGMPVQKLEAGYGAMAERIGAILGGAGRRIAYRYEADARFLGQGFELTVPFSGGPYDGQAVEALCRRVSDEHIARYGHAFSGKFPVEIVNLRLTGTVEPRGPQRIAVEPARRQGMPPRRAVYFGPATGSVDTPVIGRAWLGEAPEPGPFVIEEYEGTIVVPPDCRASRDASGNVVIELPVADLPSER
jgi:N-methylhydantoinase A